MFHLWFLAIDSSFRLGPWENFKEARRSGHKNVCDSGGDDDQAT